MKSLLICGISGQVGQNLLKLAESYNFNVICGVDHNNFINADCPVYTNFYEVKENIDVIVDFSSPSITDEMCDFAWATNCKIIIGTTGHNQNQIKSLEKVSEKVAVCKSNNFSIGITPFFNATCNLVKSLENFDVSLTEIHNRNKKDAPSGTAKEMAEKLNITNIYSLRGGNIAGVHKFTFLGNDEEIEITHRAYNKSVFARGALTCANKILNKQKGFFTIKQLFEN